MASRIVYVIDDDAGVLHSTAFLLQSLGCAFETFANPEEFLGAVDRLQPGCIVTDLRMPAMSGYELRRALLERSIGWPVVLMTSENGALGVSQAANRGFCGFLRKPFSPDELVAVLDTCFAMLEEPGA